MSRYALISAAPVSASWASRSACSGSRCVIALLCSGSKDASLILRGFLAQPVGVLHVPILGATHLSNRLSAAGPEAPALVNFIMSKDCPVSASLTDTDRANLLQIKQFALAQPPPSAAK